MRTPGKIITVLAAAAVLGGCAPPGEQPSDEPPGADLNPIEAPDSEAGEQAEDPTAPLDEGPECAAEDFDVTGEPGERPEIDLPEGCAAPGELLVEDLEEGEGPEVEEGDAVEVHYELVTFSDGEVADSSWERDETFTLSNVGAAQVIAGWNEGLVGLAEDSRRLLVVPPDLGYGEQGSPPAIAGGETLVFVIDAIDVQND